MFMPLHTIWKLKCFIFAVFRINMKFDPFDRCQGTKIFVRLFDVCIVWVHVYVWLLNAWLKHTRKHFSHI